MVVTFTKETNFKVVEAGVFKLEIPEDWGVVRLGDVAKTFLGGGTPSTKNPEYWNGDIPWIRSVHINELVVDGSVVEQFITKKGLENSTSNIIPKGNIIIATRVGVGKVAVNLIDVAINQDLTGVILKKDKVDPFFLVWLLHLPKIAGFLENTARGTTIKGITQETLKNLKIPLPPLPEQQKIAHVLMSIDKAIEVVDEAIKQAERIKKGLMQELLTKGIGHKKFRVVEADGFKLEIPEGWEVVRLRDVAEIRKNKVRNDFTEVAFIPMELVPDSEIFAKYEVRNISDISSSTYCEANDLLLAKITPSFENGKQGIVPENIPNGFAFATTEVYPIVCKDINNLFLFYLLKFQKFRKMLEFSMRGTTGRQRVPKKAVEDLRIPLPPLPEQQKIAEILSKWDEVIELKKAKKERLERMKKKVMELLLTGKVRVK